MKLDAFRLSAKQNQTNRVDWVRLVWLSSVIELAENFQFDYVLLPKPVEQQSDRLGSIEFNWFKFGSVSLD